MSTKRVDTRERVGQTNSAARQLISPFQPKSNNGAGVEQARGAEPVKTDEDRAGTLVTNQTGLTSDSAKDEYVPQDVQVTQEKTDTALETSTGNNEGEAQDDFTRQIEKMLTSPKKGYLDTHTSRSYYIKNDLIQEFDQLAKEYSLDKSDVVNDALRIYLSKFKERAAKRR